VDLPYDEQCDWGITALELVERDGVIKLDPMLERIG
jgi:hypothetical protein